MNNVFVVGYYNHHNTGDEQYKTTFKQLLDNPVFLDCDKIKDHEFSDSDVIIVGGGDVLNEYFVDEIIAKFKGKKNKLIAFSVGLPYSDILVNTNKLQIFDYIFLRTKQDIDLFRQHLDDGSISYTPDISLYLGQGELSETYNILSRYKRKIVSITLAGNCSNILAELVFFVRYLILSGYHVVLIPFNIREDIFIQNSICSAVNSKHVTNVIYEMSASEILKLYDLIHISIPMRFHSCLFSIYKKVPIFPLFTTRKVKNLLIDINWIHGYQLETDENDTPIKLDTDILTSRFYLLEKLHERLVLKLGSVVEDFCDDLISSKEYLNDIIKNKTIDFYDKIDLKINKIFKKIQKYIESKGYVKFCDIKDRDIRETVVNIVSYYFTNGTNSVYNHGLMEKMFKKSYDYHQEWRWIVKDFAKNNKQLFNNPDGLFNINYIDQVDYSGAHRSGWQYVYDNIKYLHNKNSLLQLDLYVDRTFHWNREVNKVIGVIPYTKSWIGFIHHTFDTSFSDYNNEVLLHNPEFLQSLKYCKGIFVLSKYLRREMISRFACLGITVPVYCVYHPTEENVKKFSMERFKSNNDKKLVHVGGWLRDLYSFYTLNIPDYVTTKSSCSWSSESSTIRKVAIKGSGMNNYFPSDEFSRDLKNFLINEQVISKDVKTVSGNCSQNMGELRNNWYKSFYDKTKEMIDSVSIIHKLSNDDYDDILSENIVFLKLIDVSACNTLIECVMRNTPIIINKHPSVVEILGDKYPLYFDGRDFSDIDITKAYNYLRKLDKSNLKIDTFVRNFTEIVKNLF